MNAPLVLFRKEYNTEEEFNSCRKYLPTTESRLIENGLVIGRYSVLPYYRELEKDLHLQNSILINSFNQHSYIANFDYYEDVKEFTPETYFDFRDIPEKGPFVIKGRTNSRKFDWKEKMFAETREEAVFKSLELSKDGLIQGQGTVVRKFEKLNVLEYGINGLPFSNEWRFFYLKENLVEYGFYWSIAENRGIINQAGFDFADKIAKIVAEKVNFFVLDIAEKENGDWILIEINDAQMSGLSTINADMFYMNLSRLINQEMDFLE